MMAGRGIDGKSKYGWFQFQGVAFEDAARFILGEDLQFEVWAGDDLWGKQLKNFKASEIGLATAIWL